MIRHLSNTICLLLAAIVTELELFEEAPHVDWVLGIAKNTVEILGSISVPILIECQEAALAHNRWIIAIEKSVRQFTLQQ